MKKTPVRRLLSGAPEFCRAHHNYNILFPMLRGETAVACPDIVINKGYIEESLDSIL